MMHRIWLVIDAIVWALFLNTIILGYLFWPELTSKGPTDFSKGYLRAQAQARGCVDGTGTRDSCAVFFKFPRALPLAKGSE